MSSTDSNARRLLGAVVLLLALAGFACWAGWTSRWGGDSRAAATPGAVGGVAPGGGPQESSAGGPSLAAGLSSSPSEPAVRNEVEAPLRGYQLRTALHAADGSPVASSAEWRVRWERASGRDRILAFGEGTELREATAGDRLVVLEALLGERMVTPRRAELVLGAEHEIVLIGDLPPDGGIRVVDARDGEDLAEVVLVPWTCAEGAAFLPPLRALEGGCSRMASSPIALPANPRHRTYWIGAEGFAWRRVEYGTSSGTPIYPLEPGGGLTVAVEPPRDSEWRYAVELEGPVSSTAGERRLAEEPLRSGRPLRFTGLTGGAHLVKFLAQKDGHVDVPIAERTVEVVAGAVAELSFDLDAHWRPEAFGRIQLVVVVEDERDRAVLALESQALDAADPRTRSSPLSRVRRKSGRDFIWGSGPRPVGRNRIRVLPGTAEIELEVERGSIAYGSIVVPALPKLRLWALDAEQGEPIEDPVVFWRCDGEPDWRVADLEVLEDGLVFPVAPGPVEVAARAGGYLTAIQRVEVAGPWTEAMLELRPVEPREIFVQLRSEGSPVPAHAETWSGATATDEAGRPALVGVRTVSGALDGGCCSDGSSAVMIVDGPGTYRVAIGPVSAFEVPAQQTVVVGDEPAWVDFELRFRPLN